ncbi:hypothetical protein HGO34_15870 [Agrobacterium vitis]|uniref:hypothetical protein n=1 Tax=Agrobacterium vitis TaxID=373 RepID=UPI001F48A897|nr:hypothetical protein [Agrobacterium vitis]MCF1498898.1 hypothetical protein [Allorhizobium sp. Av2]MCM2441200.1 hypothetical protein [Agrobacterium vitis]
MKIDFTQKLLSLDGLPMNGAPLGVEGDTTLSHVAVAALMMTFPDEQHLAGTAKFERYQLARRVHDVKEPVDLKVEEVALLKDLIGRAFSPSVIGPAYSLLDG